MSTQKQLPQIKRTETDTLPNVAEDTALDYARQKRVAERREREQRRIDEDVEKAKAKRQVITEKIKERAEKNAEDFVIFFIQEGGE